MRGRQLALRWAGKLVLWLGLLLALIAGLIWLAGREPTLHIGTQIATRLAGGQLSFEGVSGSLYGPLKFAHVRLDTPERRIEARDVVLDWSPRALLYDHQLLIRQLTLASLDITLIKPSPEPLKLPITLRLPYALNIPDARIERLTVHQGARSWPLSQLRLALTNAGDAYHARLSLHSPWGAGQASARLAADAPFALNATLDFARNDGLHDYTAHTAVSGTLGQMEVQGTGSSGAASGRWQARLTPFQPVPLQQASVNVRQLDLRRLGAGLPQTDMDAGLALQARTATTFSGELRLANRLPGALDAGRIPLKSAHTRFSGSLDQLALQALALDLGDAGQFSGEGGLQHGLLALNLSTANLNLHGLYNPLRPTHLAGKLALGAEQGAQTLLAELTQAGYRIALNARRTDEQLLINSAQLAAGGGEFNFSGKLALAGNRAFSTQGQLRRFDPSRFGGYPAATINATATAQGQLGPKISASVALNVANSRYRGQPLSGKGAFKLAAKRIWDSDIALRLGANQLVVKGAFGAVNDRLDWRLDAPDVAAFGQGFGGRVTADGSLGGSLAQPSASLKLEGQALVWQGSRLDSVSATGQLQHGLNGALNLSARLRGYRSADFALASAALDVHGARAAHTINLAARNPQIDARATLSGGWREGQGWNGRILRLENSGRYPVVLNAPARLAFGAGHASLSQAEFALARGRVRVDEFALQSGGISSRGSMNGLDSAYLLHLANIDPGMESTLIVGGKWQFAAASQVNGSIQLWRERGDVTLPSQPRTALGIQRLMFTLQAADSRVHVELDAQGNKLGAVNAHADTTLAQRNGQWGLSGNAPLSIAAQVNMPSLAWVSPLLGKPVTLDGAVQAQISGSGTVNAPLLSGSVSADKLHITYPEQGIAFTDGSLRASLHGDTLTLDSLRLAAGSGSLTGTGTALLRDGKPTMQIALAADKLALLQRPDRQLTVSGHADVSLAPRLVRVTGKISADHALITLPRDDAPTLSSDVIVLGRQKPVSNQRLSTALDFDLDFDLGDQFYLKGRGVDARLTGLVKLHARDGSLPTAIGSVQVAEGTYSAYGQRLSIERGVVNFSGPVDNPGLNILAVRKNQTVDAGGAITGSALTSTVQSVEAGVAITGSAQAPVVKLVSTPDVPDTEKLSWLVLGHGTENSSAADFSALQTAAGVLLGMGDSVSLQARLAEATGLSEVNLTGGGSLENSILVLGKRLSKKVYLSYEQGLAGTTSLVKINYTLSRRVSVRAQTGSQSAVDVFYTFSFR
ncbi:MAG TPA: translocation/assembly module TamB domain-containing protein [Sulfuriferula sp.]|nr:translocation/assembly module TamB domain-containing protein [Sulfuriferula sp.]